MRIDDDDEISSISSSTTTTTTTTTRSKVIAVLGGDLAGVVAALSAAEQARNDNIVTTIDATNNNNTTQSQKIEIWLFTGYPSVLEGMQYQSPQRIMKSIINNDNNDEDEDIFTQYSRVLLPDSTWKVREQLIPGFVKGGKELASLLASQQFSPQAIQNWLQDSCGLILHDLKGDIAVLSNDRPLVVAGSDDLYEQQQLPFGTKALSDAGINVVTNANISQVVQQQQQEQQQNSTTTTTSFQILWKQNKDIRQESFETSEEMIMSLQADAIVLAGDDIIHPPSHHHIHHQGHNIIPISIEQQKNADGKRNIKKLKNKQLRLHQQLDEWLSETPLSRKEQMLLQSKKKKRRKTTNKGNDAGSAAIGETEGTTAAAAAAAVTTTASQGSSMDEVYRPGKEEQQRQQQSPALGISAADIARSMGHTTNDYIPGMFNFVIQDCYHEIEGRRTASTRLPSENDYFEIVPNARIRCKASKPPSSSNKRMGRLPKVEGTFVVAALSSQKNKNSSQKKFGDSNNDIMIVSGPAVWKLSSHISQELNKQIQQGQEGRDIRMSSTTTLHIHFAPDIGGIESLDDALQEQADPNQIVVESCPLRHIEIDYDGEYNFETESFPTVSYPLIPNMIWKNICRRVLGVSSSDKPPLKWIDLSPKQRQDLIKLIVDFPCIVTGIQPFFLSGGVPLKDISMKTMSSQKIFNKNKNNTDAGGFFLCGSALDVQGANIGCQRLASLVTGRVAGLRSCSFVSGKPMQDS